MRTQYPALIALGAALALTPIAASSALANPANSSEFSETVTHDDLDLTTQAGIDRLDDRIRTRINRLCRIDARDSDARRLQRECQIGALASVEQQVQIAIAQANSQRARLAATTPSPASDVTTPGA